MNVIPLTGSPSTKNGDTEDTTGVKRTGDGYSYEEYREEQRQNRGSKGAHLRLW